MTRINDPRQWEFNFEQDKVTKNPINDISNESEWIVVSTRVVMDSIIMNGGSHLKANNNNEDVIGNIQASMTLFRRQISNQDYSEALKVLANIQITIDENSGLISQEIIDSLDIQGEFYNILFHLFNAYLYKANSSWDYSNFVNLINKYGWNLWEMDLDMIIMINNSLIWSFSHTQELTSIIDEAGRNRNMIVWNLVLRYLKYLLKNERYWNKDKEILNKIRSFARRIESAFSDRYLAWKIQEEFFNREIDADFRKERKYK